MQYIFATPTELALFYLALERRHILHTRRGHIEEGFIQMRMQSSSLLFGGTYLYAALAI